MPAPDFHSRSPAAGEEPNPLLRWLTFVALGLFLLMLAFGGGASRADVMSLAPLRVSAVLVLAVALFHPAIARPGPFRGLLWFTLICFLAVGLQLVPLPPSVWTSLPGREAAAAAAPLVGIDQPWRPLSLTPDRTLNTLAAVLPPAAGLVAVILLGVDRAKAVFYVVAGVVAISIILGALQVAAGPESPLRLYRITNRDASVGLFANRNHQAALIACAVPIATWWLTGVSRWRSRVRWATLVAVYLFLLLMIATTGSRGGLVLTGIAMILSLAFIAQLSLLHLAAFVLAGGGLLTGVVASIGPQRLEAVGRLVASEEGGELRFDLLGDFQLLFFKYFPVGSGFGSFADVYREIERDETLTTRFLNAAHNDFIQLGIEAGALGYLLLLVALLWIGWFGGRTYWRVVRRRATSRAASAATTILLILLAGSLLDYPLRTPLLATLFVACAGLLAYCGAQAGGGGGQANTGVRRDLDQASS